MRKLFITAIACGLFGLMSPGASAQKRLPEYLQAEKFTKEKLNHLLFSTTVEPHWFSQGSKFWFEYKTSDGTSWYVVDRKSVV